MTSRNDNLPFNVLFSKLCGIQEPFTLTGFFLVTLRSKNFLQPPFYRGFDFFLETLRDRVCPGAVTLATQYRREGVRGGGQVDGF